ncbi:MAG: CAAD domain-containing protein [Synechococcus sp.]|nr:CAAD domain-containing protein [Synechococcus sp.]
MSEDTTAVQDQATTETTPSSDATSNGETINFTERYSEVLGKVNATLDQVDWSQIGRMSKVIGIFAAVIVAQILIKGILDTINLLPVVPGLLELLGVVVVGQWSWKNLTTSDKRSALVNRVQNLRKEYLG